MKMRTQERKLATAVGGGRLGNECILLSFARWGIYCTKAINDVIDDKNVVTKIMS